MKGEGKSSTMLMTEGVIWKQLLLFSLPLLVGNLFQQLYNTVDSIVVGNFIGSQALAAVGSSTPLINLIIGMFMGIASGYGFVSLHFKLDGDTGRRDRKLCHLPADLLFRLSV